MQNDKHDFHDIVVNASLMIDKRIIDAIDEKEYIRHIETYVRHVDNLYIYNMTNQDLTEFYEKLNKYNNIYYTELEDFGEVKNYQIILEHLLSTSCDFGVVLRSGYYYEEDSFLTMRRYLTENNTTNIAVLTPLPLRGCELFNPSVEKVRKCKGCNLVGTFINMKVFKELSPLKLEYYQSMFDYEYCLRARSKGYDVVLMQNEVLRNQNYKIVDKKFFFINLSTFDYDLMELYYQTRNRFYLWDEYENIDPDYIKLDRKLYKGERHMIKMRDKNFRDKIYMMEEARFDYINKKKGKYKEETENEN